LIAKASAYRPKNKAAKKYLIPSPLKYIAAVRYTPHDSIPPSEDHNILDPFRLKTSANPNAPKNAAASCIISLITDLCPII